jgi:carbon-monoxide dehydrogenase medium subunit
MTDSLPRLPKFEYIKLDTIESTLAFLKTHASDARPFLGGTDTFVGLRDRRFKVDYLVDLKDLEGFNVLSYDADQGLTIGAAVSLNRMIASSDVQRVYPVLVQAARYVGGYQLRNRATLVGNLCNASPCGDTIGPSILYGGEAHILGQAGKRVVPLVDFFLGPGKTALCEGEIVQSIHFRVPAQQNQGAYVCIGRTQLADLAIAGVTVLAYPDDGSTSGFRFRIALSAVAPTVILVQEAQNLLTEGPIDRSTFEQAAQLAMERCKPIDDIRASQEYRREMVYRLTLRALLQVWDALREENVG